MAFGRIGAALLAYCEKSNVHGLKYVVAKDHHWSERWLWWLLCAASWSAALVALASTIGFYADSTPVAIAVDTADRDWITPYPAIGICSASSQSAKDHAASIIEQSANGTLTANNARGLSEQLFLPSRMGYVKQLERLDLPAELYLAIDDKVKPKCDESLTSCKWLGVEFDCCAEFSHLQTSVGHCLLLNSVHARSTLDFRVDSRSSSGIGSIGLEIGITHHYAKSNQDFRVYLLNSVEIPTLRTPEDRVLRNVGRSAGATSAVQIDFNVVDLVNLAGVDRVSPEERKCRFTHENDASDDERRRQPVYELYSYDGCTVDLEIEAMSAACGCASYVYPRSKVAACNMTGMRCCAELRRKSSSRRKIDEAIGSCPADCQAATYQWRAYPIVDDDNNSEKQLPINSGSSFVDLRVRLLSWPRMRYQRYVARSSFDIFVLSGSSIGLFTGASILSFVEIVYRIVAALC
ncbi:hypothetical protein TKK_0004042 [Trichogramma kaykai]|uniref:Uncharacterized protein n=1 Tax=Trichogramma kaykai TaxID=54128 RepID=A0ABD2XPR7_9HYME